MQIIIYERVFIINRYLSLYVVSGLDLKKMKLNATFVFFFFNFIKKTTKMKFVANTRD